MTDKRAIQSVHETQTYADGKLTRVVGGLDAHGAGVDHSISHVGPFLYLDDGRGIVGNRQPPFGLHPHTGVVVATYVPRGERWASDSNVAGFEHIPIHSGEVLISNAGRGVVHDERTDSDGEHELFQCVLRLPAASRLANASFFLTRARQRGAITCVFDEELLAAAGVDARLEHIVLAPGQLYETPLPVTHSTGFVYARGGSLDVGDVRLEAGQVGILGAAGSHIHILAGQQGCELALGSAAPIDEPWVKVLGHNGFVVESDVETAAARLAAYAADPDNFPGGPVTGSP